MALRQLTEIERQRMKRLTAESVDITLIQPTWTGLDKGYMDATAPVRNYLKDTGLHDFERQGRGAREHGVKIEAHLFEEDARIEAKASLYKPKAKPTKPGDPRIWFSKLHHHVESDEMLALTEYDGQIAAINLTKVDVEQILDVKKSGPLWELVRQLGTNADSIANELLSKLRLIAAGGYIPSVMPKRADTAIGRTLEAALGISMNSSPTPDYKGIELKSYRRKKKSQENRKQLFSKVPNWKISKFNNMTEILDAFGYHRDGYGDRLNCTVSATNINQQGLSFGVDDASGILNEVSSDPKYGKFASWYLEDLRNILAKKHRETFWVSAKVNLSGEQEEFKFLDVIHTRNPILSQFDILLEQGDITMDHQIDRTKSGRAQEKGPSFKIASGSLDLLFPPSRNYELA